VSQSVGHCKLPERQCMIESVLRQAETPLASHNTRNRKTTRTTAKRLLHKSPLLASYHAEPSLRFRLTSVISPGDVTGDDETGGVVGVVLPVLVDDETGAAHGIVVDVVVVV